MTQKVMKPSWTEMVKKIFPYDTSAKETKTGRLLKGWSQMEVDKGEAIREKFCIPIPVVWSADGPVLPDGVFPLRRVQSNLSFLSWTNPHRDESKLQPKAKQLKEKIKQWLE